MSAKISIRWHKLLFTGALAVLLGPNAAFAADGQKLKALVVNGQNNHRWDVSGPILKRLLEQTGLFAVDVGTSPPKGESVESFSPKFSDYRVVILDYNGPLWSGGTRKAFEDYVHSGGGVVVYHAADNAFPQWKEYNRIIGLGGWGGRNEKDGPYLRWRDGKFVRDTSPGIGGQHGDRHSYQVILRDRDHPVTKGLPEVWMHAGPDELYGLLRGPAEELNVLATAFSDPKFRGSGEHEPVLFTVRYGKGRVFHTVLGHVSVNPDKSPGLQCVGFIVTFQRGAEWAATGKVTQRIPADFPTANEVSKRENFTPPIAARLDDSEHPQEAESRP